MEDEDSKKESPFLGEVDQEGYPELSQVEHQELNRERAEQILGQRQQAEEEESLRSSLNQERYEEEE